MGERNMQLKADVNKEVWEESDFPIVCETCLGDNPYVRMTKELHGKACKICDRPFTVFRWRPGTKARFKSCQVCQSCSKMKNVCQVCVLDLQYGLPVEVRDRLLAAADGDSNTGTKSNANMQWEFQKQAQQLATGEISHNEQAPNQKLLRMARTQPYYKRNLPHKCSFYAKGECNRGDKCPFLHEMPTDRDDPLAKQNIRDRFHGQNDPVAQKMLNNQRAELTPPADKGLCSLWVGGVKSESGINQEDIKDAFYSFGEIRNIRISPASSCAFVEFTTRDAAEAAARALYRSLTIKGVPLRLNWASRNEAQGHGPGGPGHHDAPVAGPYSLPPPPGMAMGAPIPQVPQLQGYGGPPPGAAYPPPGPPPAAGGYGPVRRGGPQKPFYPSADPHRLGTRTDASTKDKGPVIAKVA
ncbi:unnamed protein product [Chrysoparadoxa australica]